MSECAGCGATLQPNRAPGRPRKWCSERCRRRTLYTGICKSCGAETYDGSASPSDECAACMRQRQHDERYWTRERIIDSIHRWIAAYGFQPTAGDWNVGLCKRASDAEARLARFYSEEHGPFPHVFTIYGEIGSFSDALRAAGLTPRGHGQRRAKDYAEAA